MQIHFSYDKKKVIQALRFHFIGRMEVRLLLILVNIFALLAAVLLYFHKVSPLAFLVSSALWVTLMISFWFILPNTVYKKASTFKDAFSMNFGDELVRLENERGRTQWYYNQFAFFIESPHFLHLYFDNKSFFLVPKDTLEKEGKLSTLRDLLRGKIDKRSAA